MGTIISKGARRYVLLVPVFVSGIEKPFEFIDLRPVTFRMARDWEDGSIDGPRGQFDALMRALVIGPFDVVDGMHHPDADLFLAEFMIHLPPGMRSAISSGQWPAPAPREASGTGYGSAENSQGGEYEAEWPDTPPEAAPAAVEPSLGADGRWPDIEEPPANYEPDPVDHGTPGGAGPTAASPPPQGAALGLDIGEE